MSKDYKKLYEEALEKAKIFKSPYCQHVAEVIFPELRESEDERIRKEIIQFLQLPHPQFVGKRNYEEWISWLEKQGEQKPAWSEEDERMLNACINVLHSVGHKTLGNWLKSIKPQSHWKPSEEQLRAIINSAQGLYQCKEKEVLLDLYEQLKKL